MQQCVRYDKKNHLQSPQEKIYSVSKRMKRTNKCQCQRVLSYEASAQSVTSASGSNTAEDEHHERKGREYPQDPSKAFLRILLTAVYDMIVVAAQTTAIRSSDGRSSGEPEHPCNEQEYSMAPHAREC